MCPHLKHILKSIHFICLILILNLHETVGNADLRSLHYNDLNKGKLQYDRTKMYLSKIIHGFKSSTTRMIREVLNDNQFEWQKSYYEHIIRNEKKLFEIQNYIRNNVRWCQNLLLPS